MVACQRPVRTESQTSFEKAKSWVRELQRQADPSIVIMLVGNKSDLAAQRKTPRELGEQYAQEEGLLFAEASAKTGEGVEELFVEIGRSSQSIGETLKLRQ
jgi:Ras-related protein Rab-5C